MGYHAETGGKTNFGSVQTGWPRDHKPLNAQAIACPSARRRKSQEKLENSDVEFTFVKDQKLLNQAFFCWLPIKSIAAIL